MLPWLGFCGVLVSPLMAGVSGSIPTIGEMGGGYEDSVNELEGDNTQVASAGVAMMNSRIR